MFPLLKGCFPNILYSFFVLYPLQCCIVFLYLQGKKPFPCKRKVIISFLKFFLTYPSAALKIVLSLCCFLGVGSTPFMDPVIVPVLLYIYHLYLPADKAVQKKRILPVCKIFIKAEGSNVLSFYQLSADT